MNRPLNQSEPRNLSSFLQSPRLEATDRHHRALSLLLDAHTAAEELECDPWEFAVEIQSLNDAGLTNTDFRRLVKTGQVCHDREITRIEEDRRVFQQSEQAILAAFEDEAWPSRIDDPLPPKHGMDPQERLHQTIKNLNKNHKCDAIRFFGDGTGTAVCWKLRTAVGHYSPPCSLTLTAEGK